MHAAQTPKSKLKFVTLEESDMSTLCQREEFLRICSDEDLVAKAQEIEVTIPVQKGQAKRYNLNPVSFSIDFLWGMRPDGVAINEALQIVYILEFNSQPTGTRGRNRNSCWV